MKNKAKQRNMQMKQSIWDFNQKKMWVEDMDKPNILVNKKN